MLLLREEHVRQLLPMKEAIALMRSVFESLAHHEALNQPRRRLVLPTGSVLHSMAGVWGGYFGAKIYSTHPKHGAHFLFVLYEADTAMPLALFEANFLGQIRTGAASGLATHLLALPEADTLGIIGSGFQARSQLEAILQVRHIRRVRVWSRSPEKREAFAKECGQEMGVPVEATAAAGEAVRGAAIVVTATSSKDPVLEADWIAPGTHVNAIGSNNPHRRELPTDLVRKAELIAVDSLEQARIESGDLLLAAPPDEWRNLRLCELHQVAAARVGRGSPGAITIFKSNGLGVEDVAAAGLVYERAQEQRIGADLLLPHS